MLLLAGHERLDEAATSASTPPSTQATPTMKFGMPGWPTGSVRDVYLAEDPAEAATLLDKAIAGCAADDIPEIVSLGHTLPSVAS
jgi:hypothetical protein